MQLSPWETPRPLYNPNSLPSDAEAYYGNQVVDWLSQYWDSFLVSQKAEFIDNLAQNYLNPQTCKPEALDWLATNILGFYGEWNPTWKESAKRKLLVNALSFIWPKKGTLSVLQFVLDTLETTAVVFIEGEFIFGENMTGDRFGGSLLQYWILLDLPILRSSREWREAENANRLFGPVWCESQTSYRHFYFGFSHFGEYMF